LVSKFLQILIAQFNLKKIMNTSTTDAYSRDNISDMTIAKKSDYKDQKQKAYKYEQNPRYIEENNNIPVLKIF
jgi:purine-nucleoside phosphorylase